MGALAIWGEADHKVRAEALATTYNTTAQPISVKPTKMAGLETLVFWGHGTPQAFCELESAEFVELVAAWQKRNSGLRIIEMLTCNARHRAYGYADSYTEQVVKQLTVKLRNIKFRALPIAVTNSGTTSDWSILKWQAPSATWAYVGAPTLEGVSVGQADTNMHGACKVLEDFMPPRGEHVGYVRAHAALLAFKGMTLTHPYAVKRKWDKKAVDKYSEEVANVKQNCYIITGTIGMLRWSLTDIK